MSTSDTRLIITCSDLSVRILETAMLGDSPTQELYWQPFGTTALNAERGIAAYEQAIYVAGPDSHQAHPFDSRSAWESGRRARSERCRGVGGDLSSKFRQEN